MDFTITEYHKRLQQTKEQMVKQDIDVLLVTDPANMNYLSGYNAWSFYVHQLLIISLAEAEPIWIGRGQDASAARHTTWLHESQIISYADHYVQSSDRHPMDFVVEILKSRGHDKNKRIAVEMDAYYFTAMSFIQLKKGLSEGILVDGTNLVNWVRIIKSEQEIAYMKKAATIAERAMQAAYENIEIGVRKNDVAAAITHAQLKGTAAFGGDYTAIAPLLPSGEQTSACHLTWTDDVLNKDEAVIAELAGCYKRYHVPLARTIILGKPTEKMDYIANVVLEGINETLALVKPGITCEALEATWSGVIKKYGIDKESRLGYSVGLNYPPDWGEHTASIRQRDETVLEENMTFHFIPGIWLDDMGIEVSESFRVVENGCELFTEFPRELLVKPVMRQG